MIFLALSQIEEMVSWSNSTGETLSAYGPLAAAQDIVALSFSTTVSADSQSAVSFVQIKSSLGGWFGSDVFLEMLTQARQVRQNISLSRAVESFRAFLAFTPLLDERAAEASGEELLSAVSTYVRAQLRFCESRAFVRLDEFVIWECDYQSLSEEDTSGNAALAEAASALKQRQFQEARELLEQQRPDDNNKALWSLLFAESVVVPLKDRCTLDPPLRGAPGEDLSAELAIAAEVLHEGLSGASDKHARLLKLNLAAVRLMDRKFDEAALALESLVDESKDASAVINLCRALLAMGRLPEVLSRVKRATGADAGRAAKLMAEAYYHSGAFAQAVRIWEPFLRPDEDRLVRMRILERMVDIYYLMGEPEKEREYFEHLRNTFPSEPEAWFALACSQWRRGISDDPLIILEKARQLAMPELKKWIAWEKGRMLFKLGKHLSATDSYTEICDPALDSAQTREFAITLFNCGLLPAAYRRASELRAANGGQPIAGITELEVQCLLSERRAGEALVLLSTIAAIRPLSLRNRLTYIRLCLQAGQFEDAQSEMDSLALLNLPPSVERELAQLKKR